MVEIHRVRAKREIIEAYAREIDEHSYSEKDSLCNERGVSLDGHRGLDWIAIPGSRSGFGWPGEAGV